MQRVQFKYAELIETGVPFQDLKNILDDENRRDFQSKKHVSLDVKHTRFLEDILKASSSSEEEEPISVDEQRRHFQSRKHKSLDPKVTFKLDKDQGGPNSDDELVRPELRNRVRTKRHDFNSIIIDLKDFQKVLKEAEEEVDQEIGDDDDDEEEDEDFAQARKAFQAQKSLSTASRRSFRFFEMDDLGGGGKKDENIRNSVAYVRQITEDGKPMLEIYRPTTNPIYIYTQVSYWIWARRIVGRLLHANVNQIMRHNLRAAGGSGWTLIGSSLCPSFISPRSFVWNIIHSQS